MPRYLPVVPSSHSHLPIHRYRSRPAFVAVMNAFGRSGDLGEAERLEERALGAVSNISIYTFIYLYNIDKDKDMVI